MRSLALRTRAPPSAGAGAPRGSGTRAPRGAGAGASRPRDRLVARRLSRVVAAASPPSPTAVADAKADLFDALPTPARTSASRTTRGLIEEAVLGLEALTPPEHDWAATLPGRWRLAYTTAADVAPFLGLSERAAALLPPFLTSNLLPSSGDIFQEFDPPAGGADGPIEGAVRNVIRVGLPPFLASSDGLTATVSARYEARSGKRLRLRFEEAAVGQARLSGLGEALLAPAALPGRGSLQHRAVLAVNEARLAVPLWNNPLARALQPVRDELEKAAGSEYLITYLDGDTLIGRQTGTGGLFVFFRAEGGGDE